jgi:hypothetical protein
MVAKNDEVGCGLDWTLSIAVDEGCALLTVPARRTMTANMNDAVLMLEWNGWVYGVNGQRTRS